MVSYRLLDAIGLPVVVFCSALKSHILYVICFFLLFLFNIQIVTTHDLQAANEKSLITDY